MASRKLICVSCASLGLCLFLFASRLLAEPADVKRVDALIKQLDSDKFSDREAAASKLIVIGKDALPALENVLASKPSLEVRRRLENVMDEISVQVAGPLIALLDEDEFAVRQKAHEDLERMEQRALPALRKALAKNPSAEVKSRVEALIAQSEKLPKKPQE